MNIKQYVEKLNQNYSTSISGEHSYRLILESFISGLVENIHIINEPLRVTDCGNPDFVILKKDIPICYIETKNIGKNDVNIFLNVLV